MMRRSPLARRTRVKAKRATPRRSGRVLDPEYLAMVRALPCSVCLKAAPSEADHQGPRPFGRKADDDTAVPMCRDCHQRRTDGFLPIEGYLGWMRAGKEEMRAWCSQAIASTRASLGRTP